MGMGEQFDTVGDLVDWLLVQPRDRRVVLAKDAEGNGFSPLATVSVGMYVAESTYAGEVYPRACPESRGIWVTIHDEL